jgi:hypothetical protein
MHNSCGNLVHSAWKSGAQVDGFYPHVSETASGLRTNTWLLPLLAHRLDTPLSTAKIALFSLLPARLYPLSTAPIKTTTKYI